jgi:hypothetical protein
MDSKAMRRRFVAGMIAGLRVVWPVLSGLLAAVAALAVVIGRLEGWSVTESIYFAFVSGLTIGYGDFAPRTGIGRLLAVFIGVCGVLFTALTAAVAVKALPVALDRDEGDQ